MPVEPRVVADRKYFSDGSVREFRGNTVVCQLLPESPLFGALREVQQEIRASSLRNAFALLPPASFHMTVCSGVNDQERFTSRWSRDITPHTNQAVVDEHFRQRLKGVVLPDTFRVVPDKLTFDRGIVLNVRGADAEAEKDLWFSRGILWGHFHHMRQAATDFSFHISLAYVLRQLSAPEMAELERFLDFLMREHIEPNSVCLLGSPAYCVFEDMTYFDPILNLGH